MAAAYAIAARSCKKVCGDLPYGNWVGATIACPHHIKRALVEISDQSKGPKMELMQLPLVSGC
jgi:hypothetical protein